MKGIETKINFRKQVLTGELFYYRIFCLSVVSDFPIDSLQKTAAFPSDQVDVQVISKIGPPVSNETCCDLFLYEKEDCWIQVEEGKKVIFFSKDETDQKHYSSHFFNVAIITALYQRSFLVFHGSCIAKGEHSFAFIGESGAGKSTTAAYFYENGFRFLGDEICAIKIANCGFPIVYPSYPEIGLWPESEAFLNKTFSLPKRLRSNLEGKIDFQVRERIQTSPLPLKKMFILREGSGQNWVVQKITEGKAIQYLNENSHLFLSYISVGTFFETHFKTCLKLLKKVELYLIERPKVNSDFQELLNLIK